MEWTIHGEVCASASSARAGSVGRKGCIWRLPVRRAQGPEDVEGQVRVLRFAWVRFVVAQLVRSGRTALIRHGFGRQVGSCLHFTNTVRRPAATLHPERAKLRDPILSLKHNSVLGDEAGRVVPQGHWCDSHSSLSRVQTNRADFGFDCGEMRECVLHWSAEVEPDAFYWR